MSGTNPIHGTLVGDTGQKVAFCHGLLGRGRNFSAIAKALQPEFQCLLLDMPDHGESAWTEKFDYGRAADLVADALASGFAADGPVDLVGHSMGGKIAMTLALRRPELVDRLVVVDVSPTGSGSVTEFEHLLSAMRSLDLTAMTSLGDADRALAQQVDKPSLRGFLLQNLRRVRGDSQSNALTWQANLDLLLGDLDVIIGDIPHLGGAPGGATFDHPVLWVAGAESDYVTDDRAPTMRALFPRTRLIRLKGAGHWVHSEQPEVFTSVLRQFLGRT